MPNYFKLAFRNLKKRSFYSILNIFGLSLGIACGLILFQFINYQSGFDGYHRNAKQIYKVVTDLHFEDGSIKNEKGAPLALVAAIRAQVPQVKDIAFYFSNFRDKPFTVGIPQPGNAHDKLFSEHANIAFADKHWFNLFDFEWKTGNAATALDEPNTAVLTQSMAEKYFGNADPIGKIIHVDAEHEIKITGLLKDHPVNTDFKADIFISLTTLKRFHADDYHSLENDWGWINSSNNLLLQLAEGVSPELVHSAITGLKKRAMGDMARYYDFHLQPLNEIHFDARYGGVISKSLLSTLSIIGLFILIIACVNFINLATAQNARRTKEISTRKILGSTAAGIFWQFITETAFITILAVVLSLLWVLLSLPVLNNWLQTSLQLHLLQDKQLIMALLSLVAFIMLAAGVYPALLLSRFKPVEALKNKSGTAKQPWLRKGLIVFQNLVAQSLIICALIITLQSNFVQSADLGFNKEAIVMIPIPKPTTKNLVYLRNQLMSQPGIKDASFCFRPPASEIFKAGSIKIDNRDWESYSALCILGDSHYLKTFGLQLIAGRNLAQSDTVHEFLVTEDMVNKLGFANNAGILGHTLVAGALNDHPGTIVGVIKDIQLHSLHSYIEPLLITTSSEDYAYAGIKINGLRAGKTIQAVKQIWESIYPDNIFDYHFLDEQIAQFYKNEDLLDKLIGSFAVLAVIISCVGLLGLISLLTIQRTKEIGIRKVVGASVASIGLLLSKDFAKLVVIALLLATALSWFAMNKWLQGFAYRITIPWWVFLLAGICNLALALLTICYHALKAALVNPIHSLRTE